DVAGPTECERFIVIIELQLAFGRNAHGIKNRPMHFDNFLERVPHIIIGAVYAVLNVEISRLRDAVLLNRQLFASTIERNLSTAVIGELVAQLVTEKTPVLYEVQQRTGMPILGFLLGSDTSAARRARRVG